LGLERDRVHEDVAADPGPEQLLDPGEIRRDQRADPLTVRVHEIDRHDPVLDQVVVEANGLVVVGAQADVGEIAFPDDVARGGGGGARGAREETTRPGSHARARQPRSSADAFHDSQLRFYGVGFRSPSGSISQRSIMAWSSWITL